jgi:enoyl-CoA hydratase
MAFQHILFDVDASGTATITINRPEKRNALCAALLNDLGIAFDQCASEPEIRALIITGAGDKAFVAGADISELTVLTSVQAVETALRGQSIFRKLETMRKPSVAAINGFALGGGLELAMACTIRFASENAKLGQPEVKLGIIPGYGGSQRLPRLVGRGRALEILLSGEPINAAEAHRIGLVNAVTPQPELLSYTQSWVGKVLSNGPVAIGLLMHAVDKGLDVQFADALRIEAEAFGAGAGTEDFREGTRAFLEKRPAVFAGK